MDRMKVTVVMFHDDEMGGYSVIIPTIPPLATMGQDMAHSLAMAKECFEISLSESADWNHYQLGPAGSDRVVVGTIELAVLGGRKVTVVLLRDHNRGDYEAIIPGFAECAARGDTVQHTLDLAKEWLEGHLREPDEWDLFNLDHAYSEHVVVGAVEVDAPPRPEWAKPAKDATTPDAAVALIAED